MRSALRFTAFLVLLLALACRLEDVRQYAGPPVALAPNPMEAYRLLNPRSMFLPAYRPFWPRIWPDLPTHERP